MLNKITSALVSPYLYTQHLVWLVDYVMKNKSATILIWRLIGEHLQEFFQK